jgi:hypothetical protein
MLNKIFQFTKQLPALKTPSYKQRLEYLRPESIELRDCFMIQSSVEQSILFTLKYQ